MEGWRELSRDVFGVSPRQLVGVEDAQQHTTSWHGCGVAYGCEAWPRREGCVMNEETENVLDQIDDILIRHWSEEGAAAMMRDVHRMELERQKQYLAFLKAAYGETAAVG